MKNSTNIENLFNDKKLVHIAAPMVRYSKLQFRNLVRNYGCDLCFTPMILADSFCKSVKARNNEFTTNLNDTPLIVQFAANSVCDFVSAAYIVAPFCDGVDLNCGCPQRWAKQMGLGCKLLENPQLIYDMTQQCRNQISKPFSVSIKMRLCKDLKTTVEICRQLEKCNASFITVHARTPDQNTGEIDEDALKIIAETLRIPMVANGGIRNLNDCERLAQKTGCKGVMAANGLLTNPTLFLGTKTTTLQCIERWINICFNSTLKLEQFYNFSGNTTIPEKPPNLTFQCFHHHLVFMLEKLLDSKQRRIFNNLQYFSDVLMFLNDTFSIRPQLFDFVDFQNTCLLDLDYGTRDSFYRDFQDDATSEINNFNIFSDYNSEKSQGKFYQERVKEVGLVDEDCDWANIFLEHYFVFYLYEFLV